MLILTITKEMIIKQIARREGKKVATVRNLYNAMENIIFDHLSSTTLTEKTNIKLFEGLSLECGYVPEKEVIHPDTKEKTIVPEKIWGKAKLTRNYNRKLNKNLKSNNT